MRRVQWSYATSERLTGWPVWSLYQMAVVRARMRCRTLTITPAGVWAPWRSRSSWPLKVSLMDSMTWRSGLKNRVPGRSGSPWRAGRSRQMRPSARTVFEAVPVVVLVRDDDLAVPPGGQGGVGQDVLEHLAFVSLGAGQGEADGRQAARRELTQWSELRQWGRRNRRR